MQRQVLFRTMSQVRFQRAVPSLVATGLTRCLPSSPSTPFQQVQTVSLCQIELQYQG